MARTPSERGASGEMQFFDYQRLPAAFQELDASTREAICRFKERGGKAEALAAAQTLLGKLSFVEREVARTPFADASCFRVVRDISFAAFEDSVSAVLDGRSSPGAMGAPDLVVAGADALVGAVTQHFWDAPAERRGPCGGGGGVPAAPTLGRGGGGGGGGPCWRRHRSREWGKRRGGCPTAGVCEAW